MSIPVRAFANDADRMVAHQRRLADSSRAVTSEDDWAVWYAEYLLGVR